MCRCLWQDEWILARLAEPHHHHKIPKNDCPTVAQRCPDKNGHPMVIMCVCDHFRRLCMANQSWNVEQLFWCRLQLVHVLPVFWPMPIRIRAQFFLHDRFCIARRIPFRCVFPELRMAAMLQQHCHALTALHTNFALHNCCCYWALLLAQLQSNNTKRKRRRQKMSREMRWMPNGHLFAILDNKLPNLIILTEFTNMLHFSIAVTIRQINNGSHFVHCLFRKKVKKSLLNSKSTARVWVELNLSLSKSLQSMQHAVCIISQSTHFYWSTTVTPTHLCLVIFAIIQKSKTNKRMELKHSSGHEMPKNWTSKKKTIEQKYLNRKTKKKRYYG